MSLLFKNFGILKPVNQFQFFLFHASDFHFVQLLFSELTIQFFFDLSTSTILLLLELKLTLSLSLLLLIFYHHFYVLRSLLLLTSLLQQSLLNLLFFLFCFASLQLCPFISIILVCLNLGVQFLLHVEMHLRFHGLLLKLLVLSLQFHLLVFHVPSTLHNYICCSFASLVYLSNRLNCNF